MSISTPIRQIPALLLLLAMVAVQWGWMSHEYQAHDSGQVCEVCVAGANLGHAVSGSAAHTFPEGATPVHSSSVLHDTPHQTFFSPLLARAPPRLIV